MLLLEADRAPAAIAFVFEKGLDALGIPDLFSIAASRPRCSSPLLGTVLKYTENATYVLYLLCDTIWTWEFSHRDRPEWDQRIDRFAQHLVKTAHEQRRRGNRHRRPQFGIVPRHRNAGARAAARSRARPPRPAHRAADDRRQFPDRRLPRRVAAVPRPSAAAGGRAVDRLDRLPVAQGRDEFLPVRSDRRATASTSAPPGAIPRSCRSASATSSSPSITKSSAGSSSASISSS